VLRPSFIEQNDAEDGLYRNARVAGRLGTAAPKAAPRIACSSVRATARAMNISGIVRPVAASLLATALFVVDTGPLH
jgi:hypothetical protein